MIASVWARLRITSILIGSGNDLWCLVSCHVCDPEVKPSPLFLLLPIVSSPLTNSFFTAGTFKPLKHQKVPSAWIWATKGHDKCCTWAYLAWEWAGFTQWINKHVHIKGEVFPGLIAKTGYRQQSNILVESKLWYWAKTKKLNTFKIKISTATTVKYKKYIWKKKLLIVSVHKF